MDNLTQFLNFQDGKNLRAGAQGHTAGQHTSLSSSNHAPSVCDDAGPEQHCAETALAVSCVSRLNPYTFHQIDPQ